MENNKIKSVFYSILILFNFSYAIEKQPYSNLLSPKTSTIIDIGKKDNAPTPNISKILKEIPASVRVFENNFVLAERDINRYSCLGDEYDNVACSVGLTLCNNHSEYSNGYSIEHNNTAHTAKIKEHFQVDKYQTPTMQFGVTWDNHDLDLHIKAYNSSGEEVYHVYYRNKSESGISLSPDMTSGGTETATINVDTLAHDGINYFTMEMHSYSGGSLTSYGAQCFYYDSYGVKRTFDLVGDGEYKILMKFRVSDHKIFYVDSSVVLPEVDIYKCPDDTWVDPDNDTFHPGTCYKDYKYYTYQCPDGFEGPLITTGEDCNGLCGEFGCSCNDATPPAGNCVKYLYSCPYGDDIPCANVTTNYNTDNATNNELGYKYALGESIAHDKNLTKEPECPDGGSFDSDKSICVADPNSENCPPEADLLEHKCVVPYNCPGIMVGSNCEIKPDIECNDANARYYEVYKGCAVDKQCSKGTLNPISGMCEFTPEPPSGWKYDTELNQFVKQPLITTDPTCADPALEWDGSGRCVGAPDFTQWDVGDDVNGMYSDVSSISGLTVSEEQIKEDRNTGYAAWFVSPVSLTSGEFSGTIQFGGDTTTDAIGLLFGFQGANNYYVFDWTGNESDPGGKVSNGDTAAILDITDSNYGSWEIDESYEVAGVSNISWNENTTYTIIVRFRDDKAEVLINDNEVLSVSGLDQNKLSTGRIGFWEISVKDTIYKDFYIQTKPTCPSGYIYMDGYDICVYNEGNDVTIDIPNNRYLKAVYCTLGSLNPNTGKCEISSGCGGSYPYEDSAQNKCYGTNNYRAICPDTTHWALINSNDIPGYNYACKSTSACTGTYHDEVIDGVLYCAQDPQHSCPVNYTLDKAHGECYAEPICSDGYVYDKDLRKCVIHYTWYEYTCPSGYEGPIVDQGRDCNGNCGYDGCKCNMQTPPANNCRKYIAASDNYDLFEKRNMIVHQVLSDGNFNEKEFGIVKRFACNENPNQTCSFDVTKIWGDGDQLCFSNDAGTQACYKINGCEFWGEINTEGIDASYRVYNKSREINNLRIYDNGYTLGTVIPINSPEAVKGSVNLTGEIESGSINTTDTYNNAVWNHISFNRTFKTKPVVFVNATTNGGDSATIRIKNVSTSGFDVSVVEPYTQDGPHISQKIQYLAITPGVYNLGNYIVQVGKISTNKTIGLNVANSQWKTINLATTFNNPIVLAKIQTMNNLDYGSTPPSNSLEPWLTAAAKISDGNIKIALDFDDSNNAHVENLTNNEEIGYLIIEGGIQGSFSDYYNHNIVNFETIKQNNILKGWSICNTINFQNSYSSAPIIVATKNSRKNNVGGWIRKCSIGTNYVKLTTDVVNRTNATQITNNPEDAGIFVFSGNGHTFLAEFNASDLVTYNSALGIYLYHNKGIHSTCKMNGGIGDFDRNEGISAIKAGGVVYNYALVDTNGTIDWDINATAAGQDNISEGFNIGLMAIKLSDGNWYVAKDFKDKYGNTIDRRLPDFIKRLDNSFYKISNVIQLPDGNTTIAALDCNYKGHPLDPALCGLKIKIIMPQGNMKIEKIQDIESLLNFKEHPYGSTEDNDTIYWYENNEYNLTLKLLLDNNTTVEYRGSQKRMPAVDIPDLATAKSQINIFGNSNITGSDLKYINTINTIESESDRGEIPVLKDKLYFWDSFVDGFIGHIQFVREVKEEDRLKGFVPEDIIPYYMLEKGFVSFSDPSKKVKKTIFVNHMMSSTSPECSNIASNIGGTVLNYNANESIANILPSFTYPADTSFNLYVAAGARDMGSTCIIKKDGLHAMEDVLAAQRKLVYTGSKQMMCSPYKCVEFECKLAECPDGYIGNNIPNSYKEAGKCILNRCDFFDPNGFVEVCGKLGPCNTAKPGIVKEGNTCKELYCPKGSLDPVKGTCTIFECPDGYHEDASGNCVR